MNSDIPKQYLTLSGRPILRHTMDIFANHPNLKSMIVAINPDHQALYTEATKDFVLPILTVAGGSTRQHTVKNALNALSELDTKDDEIILIHDAARPCLHKDDLNAILDSMKEETAASLTALVKDTLRKTNDKILGQTIDRDKTLILQTPQAFRFKELKTAHEELKDKTYTDDTALMSQAGHDVKAVISQHPNPKITTKDDIEFISYLLEKKNRNLNQMMIPKTAIGYDVHAFGDEAPTLRIGGIDIPHSHKLAGHSDADVVLHAITDAVYGIMADGDIGSHFPPSDHTHKGKDSAIFLEEALLSLNKKGAIIHHIDTTIICEAPKIGPHREAMRRKIATITGLPLSAISIKATTTEQLGFTGRREGIAAQSIITASFPV